MRGCWLDELEAPLTDVAAIAARQDAWGWLLAERGAADGLRVALRATPDIARALGRLSVNRGGPRDLAALRDGLRAARQAAAALGRGASTPLPPAGEVGERSETGEGAGVVATPSPGASHRPRIQSGAGSLPQAGEVSLGALPPALRTARTSLHVDPALEQRLAESLADPAPHRLDDGNAIRPGFDAELDAERPAARR